MYVNKKERGSETFPGTSVVVTDVLSIVYLYTSLFNTCNQFRIHSSLDLFHDLNDVLVAENVVLAYLLWLMLDATTPHPCIFELSQ